MRKQSISLDIINNITTTIKNRWRSVIEMQTSEEEIDVVIDKTTGKILCIQ